MMNLDELNELLTTVPPIYLEKYTFFVSKEAFEDERYLKLTAQLFRSINDFGRRASTPRDTDDHQAFSDSCTNLVAALKTEDHQVYLTKTESLIKLLTKALHPEDSSTALLAELDEPSPINRRVIDEQLKPQAGIIDRKKMRLINDGNPIDEEEFQMHNCKLHFTRQVYWEQLLSNVVQADLDDLFDCRDANSAIHNARATTFFDKLEAARKLIEKKIKPSLAPEA